MLLEAIRAKERSNEIMNYDEEDKGGTQQSMSKLVDDAAASDTAATSATPNAADSSRDAALTGSKIGKKTNVPAVFSGTHDWIAFSDLAQLAATDYSFARVDSQHCKEVLGRSSLEGTVTIFSPRQSPMDGAVFTFPNNSKVNTMTRKALLAHFLETRFKSMVVGELSPRASF